MNFHTKWSICKHKEKHYNYGSPKLQLRIVSTNQEVCLTIATTHDVEKSASKN